MADKKKRIRDGNTKIWTNLKNEKRLKWNKKTFFIII